MSSWDVYAAALQLISKGYKVFRLNGDAIQQGWEESDKAFLKRKKAPATTNGFKDAISDPSEVQGHFKPKHWLGIVPPKNILFLDIDEFRDEPGSREEAGELFLTFWDNKPNVAQQTARGGIHVGPFCHPEVTQGGDVYQNHPELHHIKVDIRMGGSGYIATGPCYTLMDGFPNIEHAERLPEPFVPVKKKSPARDPPTRIYRMIPDRLSALCVTTYVIEVLGTVTNLSTMLPSRLGITSVPASLPMRMPMNASSKPPRTEDMTQKMPKRQHEVG